MRYPNVLFHIGREIEYDDPVRGLPRPTAPTILILLYLWTLYPLHIRWPRGIKAEMKPWGLWLRSPRYMRERRRAA